MAQGSSQDDEEITGINVTPLVDVMLVLLIIFMVTANYINNQSINLTLPKAATGESVDSSLLSLAFVVNKDSHYFIDGSAIQLDDIPRIIEEKKKLQRPLQALIAADEGAPHGAVVKLIDTIRKNGITDFALNVEASSGP
ncbi:MAG: ExbD/TolR family protein [Oligoflexales bacterium]